MFRFRPLTVIMSRSLGWLDYTIGQNEKSQSQMLQIGGAGPNFVIFSVVVVVKSNVSLPFKISQCILAAQVVSKCTEPKCPRGKHESAGSLCLAMFSPPI